MLFLRLFSYIFGYLIIEIKGRFAERLINLLPKNRIYIWRITRSRSGDYIRCKIKVRDFKKIRPFVRRTGTHVKIKKKRGLPFIIHRYRHRYGIIVGLLIFFATVYILSQVVWQIEIKGNTAVKDGQILTALKNHDIDTGKFRWFINTRDAEVYIKRELSLITWVQVNIDGSKLVIEVKEMQDYQREPDFETPCDIIADRDCVITDMMVLEGQAMVKPGTAVAKGDLIVSGVKDQRYTAPFLVHSNAIITGEYTVTVTSSVPTEYTASIKTGRQYKRFCLQIFNKRVKLYVGNNIKYNSFTSESFVDELKPLGFALPFALVEEQICEDAPQTLVLSQEDAMAAAEVDYDMRSKIQLANCNILSADIKREQGDEGATITGVYRVRSLIGVKHMIDNAQ